MRIACFPFTYLNDQTARAIYRRLGRFDLYQPVKGAEPQNLEKLDALSIINLKFPVSGDESRLMEFCRSYRTWGEIHQRDAANLSRLAESGFYNESFASNISSEVLKGRVDTQEQKIEPLFNARIFLQLAQEYDISESEIERQLRSSDMSVKMLFEELKGEGMTGGEGAGQARTGKEKSGLFMASARINAWALLCRNSPDPPDLFVTCGTAVIDVISERFPDLFDAGEWGSVPDPVREKWKLTELITAGTELDQGPNIAENDGFCLKVYILPGHNAAKIMEELAGGTLHGDRDASDGGHSVFFTLLETN